VKVKQQGILLLNESGKNTGNYVSEIAGIESYKGDILDSGRNTGKIAGKIAGIDKNER